MQKESLYNNDYDKLSKQVILLKNIVEDFQLWTSNIPADVYLKLTGSKTYQVDDPRQSIASSMFSFIFDHIGDLDFPGSSIVGKFFGGIVDYYKEINDNNPENLPPDIRDVCADLGERLSNTLKQMIDDLSDIQANPEKHWNDKYTIPFGDGGDIYVYQLNDYVIPDKDDSETVLEYNKIIDTFKINVEYQIVKQAIVSTNLYKIGTPATINFIEGDFQQLIINPKNCLPGGKGDGDELTFNLLLGIPVYPFQLNKEYDPNEKINKQAILSRYSMKNGSKIQWAEASSAVNNPATKDDFYKLVADHIKNAAPATYFVITEPSPEPDVIMYRRFLLITGDSEYNTEESTWTHNPTWYSANEDLCNYLFKDDSFGNIINPDGIALRKDVFENWGLEGYEGVVPYSNDGEL